MQATCRLQVGQPFLYEFIVAFFFSLLSEDTGFTPLTNRNSFKTFMGSENFYMSGKDDKGITYGEDIFKELLDYNINFCCLYKRFTIWNNELLIDFFNTLIFKVKFCRFDKNLKIH